MSSYSGKNNAPESTYTDSGSVWSYNPKDDLKSSHNDLSAPIDRSSPIGTTAESSKLTLEKVAKYNKSK